ncbi:MAG: hypothetical protein IMZ73_03640 [Chloroflexi bacterium]|nr:hypothetical protein [Chloroflexota bacterium]
MTDYTKFDSYLETHMDESIAELSRLVAQPSVGAQNLGRCRNAPHWWLECCASAASPPK